MSDRPVVSTTALIRIICLLLLVVALSTKDILVVHGAPIVAVGVGIVGRAVVGAGIRAGVSSIGRVVGSEAATTISGAGSRTAIGQAVATITGRSAAGSSAGGIATADVSIGTRVGSQVAANVGRDSATTVSGTGARTASTKVMTYDASIASSVESLVGMIQRSGSILRSVTSAAVRRLKTTRTKSTTRMRRQKKRRQKKKDKNNSDDYSDYSDYNDYYIKSLFNDYNSNDYNSDYVAPGDDSYYYYSESDSTPDTACEGTPLGFSCPTGMIIVSIEDAFYGRQSRATCPYGVYNDPNMNTNCKALTDDVANAIAWQCVGLNSCSITAHAAFLGNMALPGGDPCSGTWKYVSASVKCAPKSYTYLASGSTTGNNFIWERDPLVLSCPTGMIITSIQDVFYGRTDGTFNCKAKKASIVAALTSQCLAQPACTITALAGALGIVSLPQGDPCPWVVKWLKASAYCSPPETFYRLASVQPSCEGDPDPLVISCPTGMTIISIQDALYGNRSAQCFANTDDVTSVLGKQCLGHSSCTIKPYRDYLEKIALSGGDPCPRNKNCLSGTAYCVPNVLTATSQRLPPKAQRPPPLAPSSAPNWFTTASVQPSSGRSCENDDPLMISCPDGMIISRITNAFYGRYGSTICPYINGRQYNECQADVGEVTNVLGKQCLGRTTCSILPYGSKLGGIALPGGDPCPYAFKWLSASAYCSTYLPSAGRRLGAQQPPDDDPQPPAEPNPNATITDTHQERNDLMLRQATLEFLSPATDGLDSSLSGILDGLVVTFQVSMGNNSKKTSSHANTTRLLMPGMNISCLLISRENMMNDTDYQVLGDPSSPLVASEAEAALIAMYRILQSKLTQLGFCPVSDGNMIHVKAKIIAIDDPADKYVAMVFNSDKKKYSNAGVGYSAKLKAASRLLGKSIRARVAKEDVLNKHNGNMGYQYAIFAA